MYGLVYRSIRCVHVLVYSIMLRCIGVSSWDSTEGDLIKGDDNYAFLNEGQWM